MNELVLRSGKTVTLSPTLQDAVWTAEEPIGRYPGIGPDDAGMIIHRAFRPSSGAVEEAKGLLPLIPAILAPVTVPDMRKWLKMLNGAVRNPQDGDDFDIRLAAIGFAVSQYPRQCFNDDTLREAMRTFAFFPSASDLCKLLDSAATSLQRRVDAIRRTAAYVPPDPPVSRPQLSDQERARQSALIRVKVEEFKANLAEVAAAAKKNNEEPDYGKLLETYQRALATQPWLRDDFRKKIEDKITEIREIIEQKEGECPL